MNKGKLFIISGPSGVGKGTIVEKITNNPANNLYWAKSYTTRPERESDKAEDHYIFIDEDRFNDLYKTGEILEKNFFNDNWYGSSKSEIDNAISIGKNVLKEIEVNGAMDFKQKFPEAILIFIKAPLKDIEWRLHHRGQNTEEEIKERLETAKKELALEKEYHYAILNPQGNPDQAIKEVENIIKQS